MAGTDSRSRSGEDAAAAVITTLRSRDKQLLAEVSQVIDDDEQE